MSLIPSSTSLDRLTAREREVCALVSEGMVHKKVARILGISHETVRVHVKNGAGKLPGDAPPTRKLIRLSHLFAASDSAA